MRLFEGMKRRALRRPAGEKILLDRFARRHGRPLDLAHPTTFTEKLYCRMVSWNRRMDRKFSRLTDKLDVRAYVSRKVGDEVLVKILWQGKDPRRIPFDSLPATYVIKPNHGSRAVIVVTGKPDRNQVIQRAKEWLATNYYWLCREYQYYRIPPRIMIEEHLVNSDGSEALAYKFWCFNGVPRVLYVTNLTHSFSVFFDMAWNALDFTHHSNATLLSVEKPRRLDRMVAIAARLSEDFDFVRVDLYSVDDKIYFNELTFTPSAGYLDFTPAEWDLTLGRWWAMGEPESQRTRSVARQGPGLAAILMRR